MLHLSNGEKKPLSAIWISVALDPPFHFLQQLITILFPSSSHTGRTREWISAIIQQCVHSRETNVRRGSIFNRTQKRVPELEDRAHKARKKERKQMVDFMQSGRPCSVVGNFCCFVGPDDLCYSTLFISFRHCL